MIAVQRLSVLTQFYQLSQLVVLFFTLQPRKNNMPYVVKSGTKNYFGEVFRSQKEAKEAKYFAIVGAKNNRGAFRAMDTKIVKVAKKK